MNITEPKNQSITFRPKKGMKAELENLAKGNRRSLSDLIKMILEDAINEKKYLPVPNDTGS